MTCRIHRNERGSALVLALAFLTVFGLWIASTLSFSESATKVAVSVREQRGIAYAADGAVEQAVQAIRYDKALGNDGVQGCGTTPAPLNAETVYVTCVGQPGSGHTVVGGNSPSLGIITMAEGTEPGLQLVSNSTIRIDGGAYSHSSITFGGSSSLLNACPPAFPLTQADCAPPAGSKGTVTAQGACDTSKIIAVTLRCPNGASDLSGNDPGLDPAPVLATAPTMPKCVAANKVVRFSPGRYTNAAALTAFTNKSDKKCANNLLWFQPGSYYFEFTDKDPTWTISDANITIVGGVQAWGATDPAKPAELKVPGQCVSDDTADHLGVQFIFGLDSRINLSDGRLELCAARAGTAQQVAVFGVKNATADLKAESGCIVGTPYVTPDKTHCPLIRTDGASTTFVVHGTVYAPAAPIDLGMTNVGYEVVSRGIISRVLALKLTPSSDFKQSLISSPGLGSTKTTDRVVLLTACTGAPCGTAGSVPKLRVIATFHDQDADDKPSVGYSSAIQSWSVVR